MKKILHISYISCLILTSPITVANSNDSPAPISTQEDLIMVEDDGSTPMPKKFRKLRTAQPSTTVIAKKAAAPPAGTDKPGSPAQAVQPTQPAVRAPRVVPKPTAPAAAAPIAAAQPASAAPVAAEPAPAAPVVAAQPAPPVSVVAAQPAPPVPVVAAQPAPTAPVVAVQPVVATVAQPKPPIDCLYHLQTPISDNELSLWAQYAALKAFEYSFDKLDDQLHKLKLCFTDQGWAGFHEALQQSGNLSIIKSQQLTVSSQVSGDPIINTIKENQWSISLPLSVVYQNTQEKFTQSLSVTLVITKKTATELGIVQLIATVKPETA